MTRAPKVGGGALALPMDESTFFKLVRVVNLTARPFTESIARANRLTLNEWRVMLVLASHPGSAAQDIAWHTGLDKMSVSRALAGLGREGRIVRKPDPDDGRRTSLWLNAAGTRLYDKVGTSGRARERRLFAAIDKAALAQLDRTLDTLIASLLQGDAEPRPEA